MKSEEHNELMELINSINELLSATFESKDKYDGKLSGRLLLAKSSFLNLFAKKFSIKFYEERV